MSQKMTPEEVYQFTRSAIKSIAQKLTTRIQNLEEQMNKLVERLEEQLIDLQVDLTNIKLQIVSHDGPITYSDSPEFISRLHRLEQSIDEIQNFVKIISPKYDDIYSETSPSTPEIASVSTSDFSTLDSPDKTDISNQALSSSTKELLSEILPETVERSHLSELDSKDVEKVDTTFSLSGLKKITALSSELAESSGNDSIPAEIKSYHSSTESSSEFKLIPELEIEPESEPSNLDLASDLLEEGQKTARKKDPKKMKEDLDKALRFIDSL